MNVDFDYFKIINKNIRLNTDQLRKLNQVLDITVENSEKYKSMITNSIRILANSMKEFRHFTYVIHILLSNVHSAIKDGNDESKIMKELKNEIQNCTIEI